MCLYQQKAMDLCKHGFALPGQVSVNHMTEIWRLLELLQMAMHCVVIVNFWSHTTQGILQVTMKIMVAMIPCKILVVIAQIRHISELLWQLVKRRSASPPTTIFSTNAYRRVTCILSSNQLLAVYLSYRNFSLCPPKWNPFYSSILARVVVLLMSSFQICFLFPLKSYIISWTRVYLFGAFLTWIISQNDILPTFESKRFKWLYFHVILTIYSLCEA